MTSLAIGITTCVSYSGGIAMRIAAICLLAVTPCGCAMPMHWDRAGSSTADLQRDAYECERDARQGAASFGGGLYGEIQADEFQQRCMMVKGWMLVPG